MKNEEAGQILVQMSLYYYDRSGRVVDNGKGFDPQIHNQSSVMAGAISEPAHHSREANLIILQGQAMGHRYNPCRWNAGLEENSLVFDTRQEPMRWQVVIKKLSTLPRSLSKSVWYLARWALINLPRVSQVEYRS